MSCWLNWKKKYSKQIKHVVGYEEAFVDKILSQIPEISPDDVTPQYHFSDDSGGNRYIDFMVLNKAKGYYLPIELDGTYKDVDHHRWKDFLVRQNSLITKFGIVLRFSNKQMLWEPRNVIQKIQQTLAIQASNKVTDVSKQKERENLVSWYKDKLAEMETNSNKNDNLSIQVSELRNLIEEVRLTQPSTAQTESAQSNEKNDGKPSFWFGVTSALVVVLLIGMFLVQSDKTIAIGSGNAIVAEVNTKVDKQIVDSDKSTSVIVEQWEEVPENQVKQTLSDTEWPPIETITAEQAFKYVGSSKTVCGMINQVHHFSKGVYLNLDKVFPDTQFSIVIWDSDADYVLGNSTSFNAYSGASVCVSGNISTFNGRSQIIVNESIQLQVY